MNQLNAVITSIETEAHISLVTLQATGITFSTLVIDTPASATYLHVGNEVVMVFKETAMSVAKNMTGGLSIRNRFPATVTAVDSGSVLTAVTLNFNSITLRAVITTRSANNLLLAVGDKVEGLVKTNDVSLMQKE